MNFNPVRLNYKGGYTKPVINSSNNIVIEHLSKAGNSVRKLEFPCSGDVEYFDSRVVEVRKLDPTWRDVYHVKFDRAFAFVPGDSIGLLCPNDDTLVDEVMKILGVEDFDCRIERIGSGSFSYAGKVRDFFKHYFDFTTLPKKSMLMRLSRSCDEEQRKQIEYLCSREGMRDYLRMGSRWNDIVDFIRTFGSKPSLEDMLGDCEVIKPRYFSLINRSGEGSEIIIGVISKAFDGFVRCGHVSRHLTNPSTMEVEMCLRSNVLFRMDSSIGKMLGICTGTGIAPFMSFAANILEHQSIWLLYGFRNDEDDISRDISDGRVNITRIKSGDGAYVTDYIRANIDMIREYLSDGSPVYVCGRMEMQREVFKLFENEFEDVVKNKRLIFDLWS